MNNKELKYQRTKEWRKRNPEKLKEYSRLYREKNKERIAIRSKEYSQKNKERLKILSRKYSERRKKWKKDNADKIRVQNSEYRKKNREKRNEYNRLWRLKNLDSSRKWHNEWQRNRRKNSVQIRLALNISTSISHALRGKKNRVDWEKLVGYTVTDLMKHLEVLFDKNMNWENYGSYWHVDHRKPKSWFKYETYTDSEFKKCWSLSNLQPLEKMLNFSKRNLYESK